MQGDLMSQSNIMKNKTLADLAKFDVTAGLSAEELGTKLQEIQSNRGQYMAGLRSQFNIAQLQAEAARYGSNLDYQAALRQAEAMESAAMWQGIGSLASGGAEAGTAASAAYVASTAGSDYALKENIELVDKSNSGINIYEFDYKDKSYGKYRYRGVMAQEVPEASFRNIDGYLWVDYSKVDVLFERVN